MSDQDTRSCSTCVHAGNQPDQQPCAACIKYVEPWKPHWEDARHDPIGKGNTPEAMTTGGVKFDGDKPRMDLLDAYAIEQLSKVLTFGATKYAAHNWRKGIAKSRLIAAALRHLFAYLRGEDTDPETGLSHAAHAMCCCMFLLGLEHRVDLDDRYKEQA